MNDKIKSLVVGLLIGDILCWIIMPIVGIRQEVFQSVLCICVQSSIVFLFWTLYEVKILR